MQLQLSKQVVEIKDELGWWDEEKLKSIIAGTFRFGEENRPEAINAEDYTKAKIDALRLYISSIKEGEKVIPFSETWLGGLSREDGKKLSDAISLDALASGGIVDVKKNK